MTLSIIAKPLSIMPECSVSFMLNEVYAECQNDLFLLSVVIPNVVAPSVTVPQPTYMLLSSPSNIRLGMDENTAAYYTDTSGRKSKTVFQRRRQLGNSNLRSDPFASIDENEALKISGSAFN